ncbi:major Facilitator Superfamily protein [Variibacter gotjawalensis]|uniref:Major Facilitator Superfamily protein n=1 Tax=Variibacter gotjawalensis TaxID=1333996 RepID=A0A0S3PS68_9BRAD|nr:MFS transporter [Variibacter gotjawalensis]NIK49093.1 MFS family permease [Variibacter gotjawalensis]RZS50949.1 putative MFS family arabinose efflux permease [Variibacter gotjawalensis]BAT58783.1 major Facilitator Superfamily protein [Variibacter gotjawalensis]
MQPSLLDSKQAWGVTSVCVAILACGYGAPWLLTVALKNVAAEMGGQRSVPAFANALAWFGAGAGGLLMGRLADRISMRWTALCGTVMIAVGLMISSQSGRYGLYAGHGIFIGLFGIGALNAPLAVYVTRWFERRRGSALALISSGSYLAGTVWPPIFERLIGSVGWRQAMFTFAIVQLCIIAPLALFFLRPAPETIVVTAAPGTSQETPRVFGWPPNVVFGMMMLASFLCCVTMSMPQQHIVAFCSDLGIRPAAGALMISVLLGAAFVARQAWGAVSDKIGGLNTLIVGSAAQIVTMTGFLLTHSEAGLFTVSFLFGLGFAGLIPAYMLAARDLFPPREASWRIPALYLCTGLGMATGGWLAGYIYDQAGFYAPAFATGIAFNAVNFIVLATLVWRQVSTSRTR